MRYVASSNRERLIELQRIFEECRKNEQRISMGQVLAKLGSDGEKSYERKVIYRDIEILNDLLDMKIEYDQKAKAYHCSGHSGLTKEELEIVTNALLNARFLSKEETSDIIDRLYSISNYELKQIGSGTVRLENRIKNSNVQINVARNIKTIREAIKSNKKLCFDYYKYDTDKQYEIEKKDCVVSPYETTWFQDYYYMLGHFEGHRLSHYRLDRMFNIKIINVPRMSISNITGSQHSFDIAEYISKLVGMSSGEQTSVTIRFKNEYIGEVIDTLGERVSIMDDGGETFILRTDLLINKKLVRWILSFGNGTMVQSPESLAEEVRNMQK